MFTFEHGVAGDRHLAATVEVLVQGSFSRHAYFGVRVIQGFEQGVDFTVGGAAFNANGALPSGWQAVLDADGRSDAVFETQANQAGRCEDDRVIFTGIQLGQASVDVAA